MAMAAALAAAPPLSNAAANLSRMGFRGSLVRPKRLTAATGEAMFAVETVTSLVEAIQQGVSLVSVVDPWAPGSDSSQNLASQLFAASLFPYLGFLYYITKAKSAPRLTLFGFYFLLVFVAATIPAGIYAKVHYGTSLSNVDWLHGGAESFLTLTNLFIVLGLRQALRGAEEKQ